MRKNDKRENMMTYATYPKREALLEVFSIARNL